MKKEVKEADSRMRNANRMRLMFIVTETTDYRILFGLYVPLYPQLRSYYLKQQNSRFKNEKQSQDKHDNPSDKI